MLGNETGGGAVGFTPLTNLAIYNKTAYFLSE